jgi:hypothetical protein
MSQNGKENISDRKSNLLGQKLGKSFTQHIEFAHESPGGESFIDFSNLIAPQQAITLEGFIQPNLATLINAQILQNKANVRVHSSARGQLQRFTEFYIRSNGGINLTYETEENEILTGQIDNVVRDVKPIVDVKQINRTGELAEGSDTFVIGDQYNINQFSSEQIGEIKVYRWQGNEDPKLMVRCENNDINNDGNYIEAGNTIVFKQVGRVGGENIVAFSTGAVPTIPQTGFKQELETIGGQVDAISDWLQDVHGLPTNPFQVAPNQVDLRSFGQRVVELYTNVFVAPSVAFLSSLSSPLANFASFVSSLVSNVSFINQTRTAIQYVEKLETTSGTPPAFVARAFVRWNNSGSMVNANNISSVTKVSTGRFRANFVTMDTASYIAVVSARVVGIGADYRQVVGVEVYNSSYVEVRSGRTDNQTAVDQGAYSLVVFR